MTPEDAINAALTARGLPRLGEPYDGQPVTLETAAAWITSVTPVVAWVVSTTWDPAGDAWGEVRYLGIVAAPYSHRVGTEQDPRTVIKRRWPSEFGWRKDLYCDADGRVQPGMQEAIVKAHAAERAAMEDG